MTAPNHQISPDATRVEMIRLEAEWAQADVYDGSLLAKRESCPRPTALGVLVDGFRARSWHRLALVAVLIIGAVLFVPLCLSLTPDDLSATLLHAPGSSVDARAIAIGHSSAAPEGSGGTNLQDQAR